jgi:membrane dipeptidase
MSPDLPSHPLPVCDLHLDTVLEIQGGADLSSGNPEGHVDIARMRTGGAGLLAFACFVSGIHPPGRAFREAMGMLDEIDRVCSLFDDDLHKVDTADAAEAARARGKVGILPAIENGHAIESDLRKLEEFRRRGVRYMTLTHARHLEWAASSGEEWTGSDGLTQFGRDVVREMESLGVIVDVSHVHPSTFWNVSRIARKPFIASHSCASALCPLPRNLTDDQIRAVAASGGMVGINFWPGFLDPGHFADGAETLAESFAEFEHIERECADDPGRKIAAMHRSARALRERLGPPKADIRTVIAHIRHVVDLVGEEHVGIGSDMDGVPELPRGLPDCASYPRLLAGLAEEGFGEASVEKIAWGNFLRVIREHDR